MKKILLFVTYVLIEINSVSAQQISFQPGLILTFAVESSSEEYKYIAVIKEVSDKGISFDWTMTNETKDHGKIFIPAASLDSAVWVYYYLDSGDKTEIFKNRTTMFFPRRNFKELQAGESTSFLCDACVRDVTIPKSEAVTFDLQMDGKPYRVNAIQGEGEYNTGKFTILQDEKYPLILEYRGTFVITLMKIDY